MFNILTNFKCASKMEKNTCWVLFEICDMVSFSKPRYNQISDDENQLKSTLVRINKCIGDTINISHPKLIFLCWKYLDDKIICCLKIHKMLEEYY